MDVAFSPEQLELRRSVRAFLGKAAPMKVVRRWIDDRTWDQQLWHQMSDMGLLGLHVPEKYGGAGYGFVELCLVLEEMGSALLPGPYFSSACMATVALMECGSISDKEEWLPHLVAGEATATLALASVSDQIGRGVGVEARKTITGYRLHGSTQHVLDGDSADLLLIPALLQDEGGQLCLFAVNSGDGGFDRAERRVIDRTRRHVDLTFDGTSCLRVGTEGVAEGLRKTLLAAWVCLAAESLGGAQRCLDVAVDYATVRTQFDRPIGSFQAIKHKCADVLVAVESGRSLVMYSSWLLDEQAPDAELIAGSAKAFCCDSFYRAAAENIQIHGGIGFTWEHDAHLYFKRATSSQSLLGTSTSWRHAAAPSVLAALGIHG